MISIVGSLSKVLKNKNDPADKPPQSKRPGSIVKPVYGMPFMTFFNHVELSDDHTDDTCLYSQYISQHELKNQKASAFVIRISHAMSDIVLFIASNLDEAAEQLFHWVEECMLYKLQDQPSAYVLLTTVDSPKLADPEKLLKEFIRACKTKAACEARKPSEFEEMRLCAFRDLNIMLCPAPSSGLPQEILKELEVSRKYRAAKNHLWSSEIFCTMAETIVVPLAERPQDSLEYTKILDSRRLQPVLPTPTWIVDQWTRWFNAAKTKDSMNNRQIPIIASCLANDILKLGHVFKPCEVFNSLYCKALKKALSSQKTLPVSKALDRIESQMTRRVYGYRSGKSSPKDALQEHSEFFQGKPYSQLCFGCFLAATELHFDCGCALCESCCKAYGQNSSGTPVYSFEKCPLCKSKLEVYRIRLPALKPLGYRILALDPGGVKGIVQLELLSAIQNQLGLPLQIFFDLIIGTSVGGINALALGLLQWPVDKCKSSLLTLAKDVFISNTGWSKWLGTWSKKLSCFTRAILQDGVYDMDKALEKTFGNNAMIGPRKPSYPGTVREHIKVAVITTEAQSSKCSLLTSYNKIGHVVEESYGWVQEGVGQPKPKILDAAHFTAAAPYFFPAKAFGQSQILYQDGLNMPLPQAQSEGRKLWPNRQGPDYIISVGCGILRTINTKRTNWIHRFVHSALNSWDSHRQYESFRLANASGAKSNCERIDATLDMDEIHLDDVNSMGQMQQEIKNKLFTDKTLYKMVRQVAFKMISALFYFEFNSMPNYDGKVLRCRGSISCRYDDDGTIMDTISKLYNGNLVFSIGGRSYTFKDRQNVNFGVWRWHEEFDIRLNGGGHSASISGFPQSVFNIARFQQSVGQLLLPSDGGPLKKRKYQDITTDIVVR